MALQTTLATRFWLKTIIMGVVCVVLGLWGIWDYAVAIPRAEMLANRGMLLRDDIQTAMNTERGSAERDAVIVKLTSIIQKDEGRFPSWTDTLVVFRDSLSGGADAQLQAIALMEENLNEYGDVTPPSKYDRPMQWIFILCLPFGFYYFWSYVRTKKRSGVYRLDDDGGLITPEGSWSAGEILDIDMERWISKTGKARTTWTAKVIVKDHAPVLLDDHVYKDMHLIIGALAHRFYPEDWTPLAKRVVLENQELGSEDSSEE